MLGTPYQTKLTLLANLLTILRILLQWKLDYDMLPAPTTTRHSACHTHSPTVTWPTYPSWLLRSLARF